MILRSVTSLAVHHTRAVLVAAALLVPALWLIGGNVEDHLSVGGFTVDASDSTIADQILETEFGSGSENWVLVLHSHEARPDEDAGAEGLALTDQVAATEGVLEAVSPWSVIVPPPGLSPLQSIDGRMFLIAATLAGDEDEQRETAERLRSFVGDHEYWNAEATGKAEVARQASEQAEKDLKRSELIAAPLTLIALIFIFRGLRVALLPLAVAIFAVLGTFAVLSVIARLTTVSVFSLNLATGLGLGLAVDYCLLMVARFREELVKGRELTVALSHTVQTAGRTVLFSGATVAASLLALLVFPAAYLRSFAYAGVAVVAIACSAAVILLPALLALLGDRVKVQEKPATESFWGRQARRVVRRPVAWGASVAVLLVILGLPFLGFSGSRIDDRVLPESASARAAAATIRQEFNFGEINGITVIPLAADPQDIDKERAFRDELIALPNVSQVHHRNGFSSEFGSRPAQDYNERYGNATSMWFRVTTRADPDSAAAGQLVDDIRALDSVYGAGLIVGGTTASSIDSVDGVTSRLPLALVIIAGVTLIVLFMMTGSIVVPLKAVILNLLSLTAAFGALVWIFQDGNLAGLLNFTATGQLDIYTPVLMFCVAFGLSMDYEVFLIARIKEEYDLSGDNDHAIVAGIGSTGPVVTAAAVLLSIVFLAIATSGVTIVKMFGLGLTIAVIVDAFLVRATLTPALMKLAGRANWWAPKPLRRFHLRWGVWENEPVALPTDQRADKE